MILPTEEERRIAREFHGCGGTEPGFKRRVEFNIALDSHNRVYHLPCGTLIVVVKVDFEVTMSDGTTKIFTWPVEVCPLCEDTKPTRAVCVSNERETYEVRERIPHGIRPRRANVQKSYLGRRPKAAPHILDMRLPVRTGRR